MKHHGIENSVATSSRVDRLDTNNRVSFRTLTGAAAVLGLFL